MDYNLPGEFNGRRMQEALFEAFWEDTSRRIRAAGVSGMSFSGQLGAVQRGTFDDMFGYDAAIRVGDDDNMELGAAVWKGVFRETGTADTGGVLALADYVRTEVLSVLTQPAEDVYRGWVEWGPAVGETQEGRDARLRSMFEGEWRDALDPAGKLYYYHTATHERRWTEPEGVGGRRGWAALSRVAAGGVGAGEQTVAA